MATQLSYTRGTQSQLIVFDSATASHKFESEVSPHPQEKGSLVTDNSVRKPQQVSLNVVVTDYPISSAGRGTRQLGSPASDPGRAQAVLNELIAVKDEGLMCTLITAIGVFENMKIQSVTVQRDQPIQGALRLALSLIETIVVRSERVSLVKPTERKPQPKTDKGKKGTDGTTDAKENKSVAKKLKTGIVNGIKQLIPESFKMGN